MTVPTSPKCNMLDYASVQAVKQSDGTIAVTFESLDGFWKSYVPTYQTTDENGNTIDMHFGGCIQIIIKNTKSSVTIGPFYNYNYDGPVNPDEPNGPVIHITATCSIKKTVTLTDDGTNEVSVTIQGCYNSGNSVIEPGCPSPTFS